jgi:putative salt-induced outer membrane protein
MRKLLTLSVALTGLMTTSAFAGITDGWTGEAALTGSKTTGNTDTTDVGLGLNLEKSADVWRHKFKASADYGESADIKNKQRFVLGYQIDRDINERLYAYANADYFQDDFGAFQTGYFAGGGLGYKLVLPDPLKWDVEGGLGYRSQETQGPISVTENELAFRGASNIDYIFNDNVSLYNNTELLYSASDTYIWNETGITAQLMGNLAARASFRIDNHSNVPVGREKTDTITRVGVVYTIK